MGEEYNTLREEMLQKIELHNKLIMFSITTTVAILAYAFSQDNCYLFLLPFCIIIPISLRIIYYRRAMVKITSYIIVFLEKNNKDLNWETRNHIVNDPSDKTPSEKLIRININYDCFILSCACYALYLINYLQCKTINFTDFLIKIIMPLLLVIIEFFISKKGNNLYKVKQYWIDEWKKIKDENNESLSNSVLNTVAKNNSETEVTINTDPTTKTSNANKRND